MHHLVLRLNNSQWSFLLLSLILVVRGVFINIVEMSSLFLGFDELLLSFRLLVISQLLLVSVSGRLRSDILLQFRLVPAHVDVIEQLILELLHLDGE